MSKYSNSKNSLAPPITPSDTTKPFLYVSSHTYILLYVLALFPGLPRFSLLRCALYMQKSNQWEMLYHVMTSGEHKVDVGGEGVEHTVLSRASTHPQGRVLPQILTVLWFVRSSV